MNFIASFNRCSFLAIVVGLCNFVSLIFLRSTYNCLMFKGFLSSVSSVLSVSLKYVLMSRMMAIVVLLFLLCVTFKYVSKPTKLNLFLDCEK